jgi:hypothetical protein
MRKKFRTITIDNVKYTWSAGHNNCDGGNLITIWKDKKVIHSEVVSGSISITPSVIKEKINEKNRF